MITEKCYFCDHSDFKSLKSLHQHESGVHIPLLAKQGCLNDPNSCTLISASDRCIYHYAQARRRVKEVQRRRYILRGLDPPLSSQPK